MPEALLAGTNVVDLGDEPAARAARILADLGASVTRLVPSAGDPLPARSARAWNVGKELVAADPDDPIVGTILDAADIVFDTPFAAGYHRLDPARAPQAVWVHVTPFGSDGPRASWRATDLGVMAASGNMYCTGDRDRAPVRCTEPTAYAHTGPEAAFAALSARWAGGGRRVDLSMQETVLVANMATPARFPVTGFRGVRRGADIGRTREIWPTLDGYVSFGLRGGKARVPSLETITRLVAADGIAGASALTERDWNAYNHTTATDDELRAIEAPVAEYFARHTMRELYDIACATNLMLAPANSPAEIYASAQLAAREFFGPPEDRSPLPRSFLTVRLGGRRPTRPHPSASALDSHPSGGAWSGVRILEFGSGAAGPIASRYFAEHGATVLRVESKTRPDFLRVYALGPNNPHGLEGAPMYDGLNVGKRNVTCNLKHPDAVALVRRLALEWADAIAENFAPRAMKGFGLDDDALRARRPDLVMVSACLNGQTGPHKDYPGFGGQGAALSGYNALTGWPDREPVGPHGTITDSLAPRFVATALAAGLLHRARTGQGVYLDISQVETAIYSLTPWLLDHALDGHTQLRDGNRHRDAVPHGAFPCADEGDVSDRWVAIACWSDDDWQRLAAIVGIDDPALATLAARRVQIDRVEEIVASWTATRQRHEVAAQLQAAGIEAVPVADFGDLHDDPQLAHRDHFVSLTHPYLGPGLYERNGFRIDAAPSRYGRAGPTLGQDNDWVLRDLLGLDDAEIARLVAEGAVE
ncbi:MAG TPA: CoA transferase [Acidimicrobiia bacterium]|nr:CoA transferase [Acidimicrobiia bacterium]